MRCFFFFFFGGGGEVCNTTCACLDGVRWGWGRVLGGSEVCNTMCASVW